jgi:xanthine dehydrogenase accessory factor
VITNPHFLKICTLLNASERCVLATVARVQGSGPREEGAWMAVFPSVTVNTIGGGHLEFDVIAKARAWLAQAGAGELEQTLRFALGPSLGQCCGGVVDVRLRLISLDNLDELRTELGKPAQPLALFGGGHVGRALIQVLGNLPFDICWIDSRDEIFPDLIPANVRCEHSDPVQAAVADLSAGSSVLIMSFSHAEDLDVLAACLKRQRERGDLRWLGLIGSKTKWATFRHRLQARGFTEAELAQVTCPIGIAGIAGKQPEVIAISVAAQLLQQSLYE